MNSMRIVRLVCVFLDFSAREGQLSVIRTFPVRVLARLRAPGQAPSAAYASRLTRDNARGQEGDARRTRITLTDQISRAGA
jgi:hypothetical protein